MDEVALVSSEQQKFQKSVKGIKNLLKSGKLQPRTDKDAKQARFPKREKRQKKKRGLVYISHIPHGFYENEMTQYFRQFGVVTNARVIRSRRTGRSKGAAFVEFLEPSVAEIVAETMNNYLMGKRLLKAELIPPEKQKTKAFRKNWNTHKNPAGDKRLKLKKLHNEDGTDVDDLKLARKQLKNVLQTKKKLKELGIDYDFFAPVEVPSELLALLNADTSDVVQRSSQTEKKVKEKTMQAKKGDQDSKSTTSKNNITQVSEVHFHSTKLSKKAEKENQKSNIKSNKKNSENVDINKKVNKQENVSNKKEKKHKVIPEKEQIKNKKQEIFEEQNFIKIDPDEDNDSDNESESNDEFDSDQFEMTIESDDDFDSEDEEDSNDQENADDEEDSEDDGSVDDEVSEDENSSEEELPPSKQAKKIQNNSKKSTNNKQPGPVFPAKDVSKTEKRKLEPVATKKKFQSHQQKKGNKKARK